MAVQRSELVELTIPENVQKRFPMGWNINNGPDNIIPNKVEYIDLYYKVNYYRDDVLIGYHLFETKEQAELFHKKSCYNIENYPDMHEPSNGIRHTGMSHEDGGIADPFGSLVFGT